VSAVPKDYGPRHNESSRIGSFANRPERASNIFVLMVKIFFNPVKAAELLSG
jgi:hypothetical protein